MMHKKTGVFVYIANHGERRNSENAAVSSDINAAPAAKCFKHYGNPVD